MAALLACDWWMVQRARGRMVRTPAAAEPRMVALVLGARVYPDGRLSAMLEDRVYSGVELYKAGRVQKVLMSGDNRSHNYDEVSAMRRRAIDLGVPPDDVVRDYAGFRTLDSIYRARDIWGQDEITIVTQEFHLPRAIFLADKLGVKSQGFVADRRQYYHRSVTRSRLREVFARATAVLDIYLLKKKPHFLGRKESLSGEKQDREEQGR